MTDSIQPLNEIPIVVIPEDLKVSQEKAPTDSEPIPSAPPQIAKDTKITKIMEEVNTLLSGETAIDKLLKEIEQEEIANRQFQGALDATQTFLGRIGSHTELTLGIEKQISTLANLTVPKEIIETLGLEKFEELNKIVELSGESINLISLGCKGTSIVLGLQIIKRSKRVFEEILDKNEKKHLKDAADKTITPEKQEELAKTYKDIKEQVAVWKEQIRLEEEDLNVALFGFAAASGATALSLLNQGINYIPANMLPSAEAMQLSKHILGGLGWALKGIEVIVLAVEIEHKKKQGEVLDSWIERFDKTINSQNNIKIRESLPEIVDANLVKRQLERLINHHTESNLKILRRLDAGLDITISNKQKLVAALRDKDDELGNRLLEVFTEVHQILRNEARQKRGATLDEKSQKSLDEFNKDKKIKFGKIENQLRALSKELAGMEELDYSVGVRKKSEEQVNQLKALKESIEENAEDREVLGKKFDELIGQSNVANTLQILNALGAGLDKSMTKEELRTKLEENPQLKELFIEKKIALSHLSMKILDIDIENTADGLLKKRELIEQQKIELLKFSFSTLEDKIKKLHRTIFDNEIEALKKLAAQDFDKQPSKEGILLDFIEKRTEKKPTSFQEEMKKGVIPTSVLGAYESYIDVICKERGEDLGLRDLFSQTPLPSDLLEARKILVYSINSLKNDELEKHFNSWYASKTEDKLLKTYVQNQETIERAVKAPLVQAINKKHKIEKKVLGFNLTASKIYFALSVASLALGAGFALVALLGTPLAAAGAILFFLSIGATVATLSSLIGGYYLGLKYNRRNTIDGLTRAPLQSLWRNTHLALHRLDRLVQKKKMLKAANKLKTFYEKDPSLSLNSLENAEEFKNYEKKKTRYEQSDLKVKHWTKEVGKIGSRSVNYGWKDFVKGAKLETAKDFDILGGFAEALEFLDEEFLGEDTKEILSVQLGIDLKEAQKKVSGKDLEPIKKSIQKGFARSGENLIHFMRRQVGKMERKKKNKA